MGAFRERECRTGGNSRGAVAGRRVIVMAVVSLLSGMVLFPACGYRLESHPGSRYASTETRIDLRPFSNASVIPDAGAFLAGRLREEMILSGFRGKFDRATADYQIDGKIQEVRLDVSSYGADGHALEHRLTLTVSIRIVEVTRGRLLWKEDSLAEAVSFFAGIDYQYTESNKRLAFEEASRRMARRIGQTLRVIL